MNEEKDIVLIVSYLEGTLTASEKTVLEERLNQEPDLQELLRDMKVLKAGIKQVAREEIQLELKALEHKLARSSSSTPLRSNWVKIAAALAIVAVAAWLLWPPTTKTPQQLFAENFEPYPNIIMPTVRGTQTPDSTLKAQAYRAYDQKDYKSSIELFESMEVKDEGTLLYLGNSYLAEGATEKAIPIFKRVISDFDTFDEQAEWYLAGCYLKLNDVENTNKLLKEIALGKGSYQAKAEKLLSTLTY